MKRSFAETKEKPGQSSSSMSTWQEDPMWKKLKLPNESDCEMSKIFLYPECNLMEEAQRCEELNETWENESKVYYMHSALYFGVDEMKNCRKYIENVLNEKNAELSKEFKDQAKDKKWIRDMVMNIFLLARAVLRENGKEPDAWLNKDHGTCESFVQQLLPWMLTVFFRQRTRTANRIWMVGHNLIQCAATFDDSPQYKHAELTVQKIHNLHQTIMANPKTMREILSETEGLETSESLRGLLKNIRKVNAKLHAQAFVKTDQHLKGEGGGKVLAHGSMHAQIKGYYNNRVTCWESFMDSETRLEYSTDDRIYGWHQMDSIFTGTAAPTGDEEGMLGIYKQKMGGLLDKVTSGMFALCPLPDQYQPDRNVWFLSVSSIIEGIAASGDFFVLRFVLYIFQRLVNQK